VTRFRENKSFTEEWKGTALFQQTHIPSRDVNWNELVKEHVSVADAA